MSDNTGQWIRDKVARAVIGFGGFPTAGGLETSITLAAGHSWNFIFTCTPTNQRLTPWNFAASTVIDDNTTIDSSGQFKYLWSIGSGMTAAMQAAHDIRGWFDFLSSNDQTNQRVFIHRIVNNDTVSHTYYVYFRAYTQTSNPGVAA